MAITTLSGVVSGLKPPAYVQKTAVTADLGTLTTQFYANGYPAAAAAPSPGINGAALTSYAGQLDFQNPASGSAYLAGILLGASASANGIGGYGILFDRLWHNSGINVTTTTEQAISSPTWPARDRNGATDGDGVFVAIEVSSVSGASSGITNTTLNYTNSSGTSGRTATLPATPSGPNAGSVMLFSLPAGDTGIRSVQGLTLGTSWVGGTIHLVAVRPIAFYPLSLNGESMAFDAIALGFPRLYSDSVLFDAAYDAQASSAPLIHKTYQYAHG